MSKFRRQDLISRQFAWGWKAVLIGAHLREIRGLFGALIERHAGSQCNMNKVYELQKKVTKAPNHELIIKRLFK